MREFLVFLPLTIAYFALKSTLFAGFPLPDIPLIIVFYMAYRRAALEGVLSSFALVIIFLAVHQLSKLVQFTTPAIRAAGILAAALVKGALMYYVLTVTNVDVYFISRVFLDAIVTGLLAPAVIALLQKLNAFAAPHKFKDSEN